MGSLYRGVVWSVQEKLLLIFKKNEKMKISRIIYVDVYIDERCHLHKRKSKTSSLVYIEYRLYRQSKMRSIVYIDG